MDDSFLAEAGTPFDDEEPTPAGQPELEATRIAASPLSSPAEPTPDEATRIGPAPARQSGGPPSVPEAATRIGAAPRRATASATSRQSVDRARRASRSSHRAQASAPGPTVDVPSRDLPSPDRSGVAEPEEALGEVGQFVRELGFPDRLTFIGAGLVVLSTLLPWKDTSAENEVIGIVTLGFASFLAALLALGALVVRVRDALPSVSPRVPWVVQLGAVAFCIVWQLVFVRVSWDGRKVQALTGEGMRSVSQPSFGVYLALICAFVALGGTLLSLKERAR